VRGFSVKFHIIFNSGHRLKNANSQNYQIRETPMKALP
jgi:hypothetical protein